MPRAPTRCRIRTAIGADLVVVSDGREILASEFVARGRARAQAPGEPLLAEAFAQVVAYFARRLRRFDLPLRFEGTPLRVEAWSAVAALDFAQFVSYADVARAIGRPNAHRAVAAAMAATPFDLFVPAHRVVGADGRMRGASPESLRARLVAFELTPARRMSHSRSSR